MANCLAQNGWLSPIPEKPSLRMPKSATSGSVVPGPSSSGSSSWAIPMDPYGSSWVEVKARWPGLTVLDQAGSDACTSSSVGSFTTTFGGSSGERKAMVPSGRNWVVVNATQV